MKYLKLFESFKEVAKYVLKEELPRRGLMEVYDKDQLLTLILMFEEKGFREGYHHDPPRKWLEKDWNSLKIFSASPAFKTGQPRIDFQWEVDGSRMTVDKRMYVDSLDNVEFTDDELLDFNDYFELKPEFRGHKLKRFGV